MTAQEWTPETEAADRAWCKANHRIWTPWGPADGIDRKARGITFYDTDCHGGFFLSPARNAQVHPTLRNDDGWYEEDCEWSKVVYTFPEYFSKDECESAEDTLKDERIRAVMTPINPRWQTFCEKLAGGVEHRCNGHLRLDDGTLNPESFAVQILSEMDYIDVESSITFFERHGGDCDCEILLNVEDSLTPLGKTEPFLPYSEFQPLPRRVNPKPKLKSDSPITPRMKEVIANNLANFYDRTVDGHCIKYLNGIVGVGILKEPNDHIIPKSNTIWVYGTGYSSNGKRIVEDFNVFMTEDEAEDLEKCLSIALSQHARHYVTAAKRNPDGTPPSRERRMMTCVHCDEKVLDLNCCENCGWSKHVLTPTKSRSAKYPFKSSKCGGPMEPTARDEDGDPTAWKCLTCGEEHRNP
jgi:hypothetical protein